MFPTKESVPVVKRSPLVLPSGSYLIGEHVPALSFPSLGFGTSISQPKSCKCDGPGGGGFLVEAETVGAGERKLEVKGGEQGK